MSAQAALFGFYCISALLLSFGAGFGGLPADTLFFLFQQPSFLYRGQEAQPSAFPPQFEIERRAVPRILPSG